MKSDVPAKIVVYVMAAATVALAIVNGQPFSMLFDPVLFWLVRALGQAWANSALVFHGTSVLISVLTLACAAAAAALAKRMLGTRIGAASQTLIAFVCALGLTWPTLSLVYGEWQ